jgi:hypothetical protein
VFALRKHAGGLQGFSWHPAQLDGIAYARQILSMSTRALLALDNGK